MSTHAQAWLKLIESKVKESKIRTWMPINCFSLMFSLLWFHFQFCLAVRRNSGSCRFQPCLFLTSQDFAGITLLRWLMGFHALHLGRGWSALQWGFLDQRHTQSGLSASAFLWELGFPTPFVWSERIELIYRVNKISEEVEVSCYLQLGEIYEIT